MSLALLWALQIGKVEDSNQTFAYFTSKLFFYQNLCPRPVMLLAQFLTKASEGDQFEFFTTGLYDEVRKRPRNKEKDIMTTWPRMWN